MKILGDDIKVREKDMRKYEEDIRRIWGNMRRKWEKKTVLLFFHKKICFFNIFFIYLHCISSLI